MVAKLHNEGRMDLHQVHLNPGFTYSCGLFTAPATPAVTDGSAALTEATFSGYAQVNIVWGADALDANGNEKSTGSVCTFTHNGGGVSNTVLGYFVNDADNGLLLFSELFPSPMLMNTNGQFISVTPKLYLGKLDPPL